MDWYDLNNPEEANDRAIREIKRNRMIDVVVLILLIAIATGYYMHNHETNGSAFVDYTFSTESVVINGPDNYTYTVKYADVADIGLTESFDAGEAVNGKGEKAGDYRVGTWHNDTYGDYQLFVWDGVDHAIVFTMNDGTIVVTNYESNQVTDELYDSFNEYWEAAKAK